MPDPNDPLGLMSDDPLGILAEDAAPVPVTTPMHIQRPVAPSPVAPARPGVWGSGHKRPAGAHKGPPRKPMGSTPLSEELYQSAKGGLSNAMAAMRRPFLPSEQDSVDYSGLHAGGDFGGAPENFTPTVQHGSTDPAQQVLRDLAREAGTDLQEAGGGGLANTFVQGGIEMIPYFHPLTGAATGAGAAMEQGKSGVGIATNAALGGLFGPMARGPVGAIQKGLDKVGLRAPPIIAAGVGGAIAGAGTMGATALETELFEDMPELAQAERDAILPAGGIGGGLASVFDVLSRGRGSFRRPYDLKPPAEPAPVDVPILEPAPPGVISYLPPEVIARMKTPGLETDRTPPLHDQIFDPQTMQTPEKQGLLAENALSMKGGGESMILPGGGAPDRPGAIPEMVAHGSPTDPYTMLAKVDDASDPLGIMPERVDQNIKPETYQDYADTFPAEPPVVGPAGRPLVKPTNLSPREAIDAPAPRDLHGIDVDAPTREIDPAVIAEVQRAAAQAERAKFATQMDELRAKNAGESPTWKAERQARAEQARIDSTPEGRALREADDASIVSRRPDETATGLETVVDNRSMTNPFDSSAQQAPLASWFDDLAKDTYATPTARRPVDIEPEARATTDPAIVPVTPGKARGSDFNRGGFITKGQATERAKAEVADPNAETRVVQPVRSETATAVEQHIGTLTPEDQAVARGALKGWNYEAEAPKSAVDNIKQVVQLAQQKRGKRRGTLQAAPKTAPEVPAAGVPRAPQPEAKAADRGADTTRISAPVRGGDAGETGRSDKPDAGSTDPVRADVDKAEPTAAVPLGSRNLARRGSTVDPIDEAAKLVERGVKSLRPMLQAVADEAAILASPVKGAKAVIDWYAPQIQERVGKTGEVGKEFLNRARHVNDRARVLEGKLANVVRPALDLVGVSRKGRVNAKSLMEVKWEGDFGNARSHLAAEGKLTDAKPDESAWADAHQKVSYASGKQAEDAGVKQRQANGDEIAFKADPNRKVAIRAPSRWLRWAVEHPADPNAKKLIAHIAEKNGKTPDEMQDMAAKAFGKQSLERPAALEQARSLDYFPTHMRKIDGSVVDLLESNPQTMIKSMASRTPMRTAFHEVFGSENPKAGVDEYVAAGGERKEAEDLFRALNGMMQPGERLGSSIEPGSGLDTFSRRLGMLMGVLRSGSLSVASAMNVPESFAKTLPMAGFRSYLRALGKMARHPKDAATEAENSGTMALQAFNWHLEPGKRAEQVERIVRDILGMPLHVVEQANVRWSAMAGLLKAADLKAGKGTLFDRVRLNWLGFSPKEIDALMKGDADGELYGAVATRFPEWTQGHASRASEVSRAGHSKWYQALTIADRFPRMTINRFMRAAKSIPDLLKQGKKGEAAAATALLAGMGMSHAASGAAGVLIRASLVGAGGALVHSLVAGENKFDAWKDFLLKAFAGALFGPGAAAVGSTGEAIVEGKGVREAATSWIYPLSVIEDAVDFTAAVTSRDQRPGSRYKDLSPADAGLKFIEGRLPLTKVAANGAASLGLGTRDMEAEASMNQFWAWRRKYAPFPAGGENEHSEFRIAMKKASRLVQDGQDPTEHLEKALTEKMASKSRDKSLDSMVQSLRSRRVLDDLTGKQKTAAEAYIGPENYDRIKTYDALLEAWAQRLQAVK